jgi:hypothetical protein
MITPGGIVPTGPHTCPLAHFPKGKHKTNKNKPNQKIKSKTNNQH